MRALLLWVNFLLALGFAGMAIKIMFGAYRGEAEWFWVLAPLAALLLLNAGYIAQTAKDPNSRFSRAIKAFRE